MHTLFDETENLDGHGAVFIATREAGHDVS
jgi:hypothetical protein